MEPDVINKKNARDVCATARESRNLGWIRSIWRGKVKRYRRTRMALSEAEQL